MPFVSVTEITDVPTTGTVGTPVILTGTVAPSGATNKTIVWSLGTGSTAEGAAVIDGKASATGVGTVVVTATITNGLTASSDYTKNFTITFGAGTTVAPTFGANLSTTTQVVENATSTTLTIAASAADGGAISYQWYSNTVNNTSGGTPISGATNASYTFTSAATPNTTTYYYCVATNSKNGATETATSTIQPIRTKNNVATIASFDFASPSATGTVRDGTVAISVPNGTTLTNLSPTIALTDPNATISPASGAATNFTNPVTYIVTAENGTTTKAYTVTVTVLPMNTHIASYALNNITATAKPASVADGGTLNVTLKAISGYTLPDSITVTMAGNTAPNYTYDKTIGAVRVSNVTGDVVIAADAAPAIVSVTGVILSKSTLSLYTNTTPNIATLTASVLPADASDKIVVWRSSNTAVATVENGIVTAIGDGQATITATSNGDSSKAASCTVTVSAYSSGGGSSSATYTITATAGTGGDISTGKYVSVGAGESAGFTFTPSKGYQIADVLINGKRIGAKNSYAFTNVRSNQTIHVTFKVANSHANPQTNVTVTDGKKNH